MSKIGDDEMELVLGLAIPFLGTIGVAIGFTIMMILDVALG